MNWVKEKIIIMIVKKILRGKEVNKMFTNAIDFLKGKKTYLVSVVYIVNAVIAYLGDGDLAKLIKGILEGTGLMTIRAGVSKS